MASDLQQAHRRRLLLRACAWLTTSVLLILALRWSEFDLRALVSSGDLGRVRDSELRAELAAFFGHIARPYEDAALADLARSALFESIGATTDLLAVTRPSFRGEFPESSVQPDFDRLFGSSQYQTQQAGVAIVERNQRNEFRRIYAQSEDILERLQAYLAGAS